VVRPVRPRRNKKQYSLLQIAHTMYKACQVHGIIESVLAAIK
jgi:hypothetical protein